LSSARGRSVPGGRSAVGSLSVFKTSNDAVRVAGSSWMKA
jgi:hypothetical protein